MKKGPQKTTATRPLSEVQTATAKYDTVKPFAWYGLQPKLLVGASNDRYEQEAESMADYVMQAPTPTTVAPSRADTGTLQRQEPDEKEPQEEENSEKVQARALSLTPFRAQRTSEDKEEEGKDDTETVQPKRESGPTEASPDTEARLRATKGQGQVLPKKTRTFMERRFGADFSGVRIHHGPEAVQLSRQFNAQAFTHGQDIYFNQGYYQPETTAGRRLLAHELTHTLQQGAAVRKKSISRTQPRVQRFLGKLILRGINALLEAIVPGYSLLNVLLGRNLVTGDKVPRTGINLIKGFMQLLPLVGTYLFGQLKETGTLPAAGKWVEKQVKKIGLNFNALVADFKTAWDKLSIWNSRETNANIIKRYVTPHIVKLRRFGSVMWEKIRELIFEVLILKFGGRAVLKQLKANRAAFLRLVKKPMLIINWMLSAVRKGFEQFRKNFWTHFKNAVIEWLFGELATTGIQLPQQFDVKGLFYLLAQIFGLTYPQIKARVVERLGPKGAAIFERIEQVVGWVKRLITEGPMALWAQLQEQLANLPSMILPPIISYVSMTLVKKATVKIMSMLNPAGAIIQAVIMIYKTVMFFINNWEKIKAIVTGIFSAIRMVAFGKLGPAANFIERVLAQGMKLLIRFLAALIGLGGIGKKVKDILNRVASPVIKARNNLIDFLINKGRQILGRGSTKKAAKPKEEDMKEATPEERKKAAKQDMEAFMARGGVTGGQIVGQFSTLKQKYKLSNIRLDMTPEKGARILYFASEPEETTIADPEPLQEQKKKKGNTVQIMSKTMVPGLKTPFGVISEAYGVKNTVRSSSGFNGGLLDTHFDRAHRIEAQMSGAGVHGATRGTTQRYAGHMGVHEKKIRFGAGAKYDGGHLIGHVVSGQNSQSEYNLAPQTPGFNQAAYNNTIEESMRKSSHPRTLSVQLGYSKSSYRVTRKALVDRGLLRKKVLTDNIGPKLVTIPKRIPKTWTVTLQSVDKKTPLHQVNLKATSATAKSGSVVDSASEFKKLKIQKGAGAGRYDRFKMQITEGGSVNTQGIQAGGSHTLSITAAQDD